MNSPFIPIVFSLLFTIILILLQGSLISLFLKLVDGMRSLFSSLFSNSIREGEKLFQIITTYQYSLQESETKNILNSHSIKRNYHFYYPLLISLLTHIRRIDDGLFASFGELKKGVLTSLQFDKRMRSERNGNLYQFFLLFLITWSFIFFSLKTILSIKKDIVITTSTFLLILFSEMMGTLIYLFLTLYLRSEIFSPFASLMQITLTISIFSKANIPWPIIVKSLPLNNQYLNDKGGGGPTLLWKFDQKHSNSIMYNLFIYSLHKYYLSPLYQRVIPLLKMAQLNGHSLAPPMKEIIDEIWFVYERFLEISLKWEKVIKLTTLFLFFILPYFYYLYTLLQTFTAEFNSW